MKCNISLKDCAVFLEGETAIFEAQGYTAGFPAQPGYPEGSPLVLGYAYPAGDADADGLPDALEYVIGTNPGAPDSDGDTNADSVEYPLAGAPVSDPCAGPSITCLKAAPPIFANGFE